SSSPTAGSAFSITLTARDAYNNTANGYGGGHNLTWSGPSNAVFPSNPVGFTAGISTVSITINSAQTTSLTVSEGSISGTSPSFTVVAAALHLALGTPSGVTAGAGFSETITALDSNNN